MQTHRIFRQISVVLIGGWVTSAIAAPQAQKSAKPVATSKARVKSAPVQSKAESSPTKKPDGVRDHFSKAMKLVQAGKTDEAIMAFESIIRQYPGHQPSVLQYAKLLYSRDRIPEAYQAFSRINPVGLDPETYYEYALSHFWMRQYQQSLYGFKKIPDGHALYDLANYYGGISALKLKRMVEAEVMMDKAVVLPEQLAKSRQNYLKHIEDMKLLQEQQGLAEEKEKERKRIEEALRKEEPVKLSGQASVAGKTYTHGGFQEVVVAPVIGVSFTQQVNDNHGFSEEIATVRTTYFQFDGGLLLPLPIQVRKDKAALGLQLTGRGEEMLRKGQERRNVERDDLEDVQRISTSAEERELTKYGSYAVSAWFEAPTPIRVWMSIGGEYMQKFPDFETADRSNFASAFTQLGSKEKGRQYKMRYSYGEVSNSESQRTQNISSILFNWHFPFSKELSLDAELQHRIFGYDDKSIDGPSSSTNVTPTLSYIIPYGFTLGLSGSAIYESDYVYHDLPTYQEVSADGHSFLARIFLAIEPVTWFSAKISQQMKKTKWQVKPEDAQETFEQNYPDYQEEFEASASLNLLF